MLDVAFRVPITVVAPEPVFSRTKCPPFEIVNFGLLVASEETRNTFLMIMLQSSMFKSPDIVTLPSQVYVLVPPFAMEPSYPSTASGCVDRNAQSMFVPLRSTGAGSSLNSIESPTPKLPGYQASVIRVSFCPDGPHAPRL